jgi:menaquinone-9 beta-reductase
VSTTTAPPRDQYDAEVIIVGGGPAGSVTALLLARHGHDVLLLDRQRFPRAKACGDCLSAGAGALLARLGLLERVRAAPHALLHGWRIVAPDGAAFDAHFARDSATASRGAIAMERSVLDAILIGAARAAGVRVLHEHVIDVTHAGEFVTGGRTRARTLAARLVIGADGLRSIVAARLGLRRPQVGLRKLSLSFHVAAPPDMGHMGEMHVGDGFCAGIAPVSADRCNLTLVADARRYSSRIRSDPRGTAVGLLRELPLLAHRIDEHALRRAPFHASGPFDRRVRRAAVNGAVLVGDAAGYYDPFTGQGVYQALASAELLAGCAHDALARNDTSAAAFAPYIRGRAQLLRGARLVQRGIETVLARPRLANRAIARIGRAPALARGLIEVTGDVRPLSSLLSARVIMSALLPTRPETTA